VLIADFFMRVNSVTWSVVSGLYRNTLVIVLRNDGIRKNAGNTAIKSFGQFGSAGGHKGMARAEIRTDDLEELVDIQDEKRLLRWMIRRFEKRVVKN
jgi:hypothetical protein